MADTTPDVSHKDQMSVICRYVDQDGAAHERLLDLKEVREKTGYGQAAAIIQSVDRAVARTLIGGGVYSYIHVPPDLFLFKLINLNLISKETSRAEHEYMNKHTPPPY